MEEGDRIITITVERGTKVRVGGLPEGYDFEIRFDLDVEEDKG